MVGTEVYARLSRDGKKVLCGRLINGRPTCRGELADVHYKHADLGKWLASEDPDELLMSGVWFNGALGFSQDKDGIWGLCNYSKKRWDHTRRSLSMAGQGTVQRPEQGRPFPKYRRGLLDDQGFSLYPPWRARCPECEEVNYVTNELVIAVTAEEAQQERETIAPWRAQFVAWQEQLPEEEPRCWGAFQEWLDARAASKQRLLKVRIHQYAVRLEAGYKDGHYSSFFFRKYIEELKYIHYSPYCRLSIRAGRAYLLDPLEEAHLPPAPLTESNIYIGLSDRMLVSRGLSGGPPTTVLVKSKTDEAGLDDLLNKVDNIRAQLGFTVLE